MVPMVCTADEFEQARRMIERERERARERGRPMACRLELGVMIETPALLWQLDELLPRVDFAAVGSNDLLQFRFAADRGNAHVSHRYDPLGAPFLRMLRHVVRRCEPNRVPLSLCGEMAGRPLEALALVGLGYRTLSMSPDAVGPVKEALLACSAAELAGLLERELAIGTGRIRTVLDAFARDRRVPV